MRELKLIRKKLNPENKEILTDIRKYIYAKGVNEKILNEIELDIAGMLLESQKRGEKASEAIGEDYKAFCDELIKNCPRKKPIDYVIYILLLLSALAICFAITTYWSRVNHPFKYMYVEGFVLHCKLDSLISQLGSLIAGPIWGSVILAPIIMRNAFDKDKGCAFAFLFFIVYIVFIVVNIKVMDFIYGRFIRDQMITINLIKLGVISGITTAVLWGVLEWRMRHQLVNYKKNNGQNQ